MKRVAVPVLLACLAATGCGGGGGTSTRSQEDQIRDVAKQVYAAYDHGDWKTACGLFTPGARAQIAKSGPALGKPGASCPVVLQAIASASKDQKPHLTLGEVHITGDTAVAPKGSTDGTETTDLRFERHGGRWYAAEDAK